MNQLSLDLVPLHEWLPFSKKPILIAGPCSAESEQQCLETARGIKQHFDEFIFRAGIWKPRTRPGSFEGVGDVGLQWMKQVKAETGALLATEVANPEHVEKALNAGIDILWVGARTTASPFSVQELANALKGVDVKLMVKNPAYPDLQLWIGALERFNHAGVKKMATIHRGFYSPVANAYRNQPQWQLALELKLMCSSLPMFCDPSHICGNTHLTSLVAQKAMDMNYDGLMIETHVDPLHALSDGQQQVTPQRLFEIVSALVIRNPLGNELKTKLEELREEIDEVDEELIHELTSRMMIAKQIGEWKREHHVRPLDEERWNQILRKVSQLADELGMNPEFAKALYTLIHDESIRLQMEVMNEVRKEEEQATS